MRRALVTGGVLVLAALVVALLAIALPGRPAPSVLGRAPVPAVPDAGSWVCVAGATDGADDLRLVAAVPASATDTSRVDLRQYADGEVTSEVVDVVQPGTALEREGADGTSGLSVQRWSGAPLAAGRVWRSRSGERPPGVVAGPCVGTSSDRWVLPALSTAGGDVAELRLANPYRTDAAVGVRLLGPEGAEEPVRLANLAVPAGEVVTVVLNEVAPERGDLAAEVVVRSGRVAVEGLQATNRAIGGVDGLSLVAASAEPASTWSFPWFEDRPGVEASAVVANTSDEPSVVGVSLQTADGGRAAGIEPVEVPAGSVRRLPLAGVLGDAGPLAGLTLDVEEGAPVTAAVVVRYAEGAVPAGEQLSSDGPAPGSDDPGVDDPTVDEPADDQTAGDDTAGDVTAGQDTAGEDAALGDAVAGPRTGLAVLDGATGPADEWVLFGAASGERDVGLVLSNPTGAPAEVDAVLVTPVGVQEPEGLRELRLEPGTTRVVALDGSQLGATVAVLVRASEGAFVAALRGAQLDGPLQVTGPLGVPSTRWAPTGGDRPLLAEPGLLRPGGPLSGDGSAAGGGRAIP